MIIHLYKKTHNITGLQYFGKTSRDPYNYKGSGVYWKRHLKTHGNDVATEIIASFDDITQKEELIQFATNYSNTHKICESKLWANLKPENGLDGGTFSEWISESTRKKMSKNRKGKVGRPSGWQHDEETLQKMSESAKERCKRNGPPKGAWKEGQSAYNKGKSMSEAQKEKIRKTKQDAPLFKCVHCDKEMNIGNLKRWHGDNCNAK